MSHPVQCAREEKWLFKESFSAPWKVPADEHHMQSFSHLIWDYECTQMVPGLDATPQELAQLCGEGSNGRILSCHVTWVLDHLNGMAGTGTKCFALETVGSGLLKSLQHQKEQGQLHGFTILTFIVNVGREEGRACTATDQILSCHWTVLIVDLDKKIMMYCDSLGWEVPHDLLPKISPVVDLFNTGVSQTWAIFLAHMPTAPSYSHPCTSTCASTSYPPQTCGDVCGVVALIVVALSVLNYSFLQTLLLPAQQRSFLQQPSTFSRFLRRIIISWFATGKIDVSSLVNNTDTHPSFQKRNTLADFTTNKPSSPKKRRKQQNTLMDATADEEKSNTQDKQSKNSPGKQENQNTHNKQEKQKSQDKHGKKNSLSKQENQNTQRKQEEPNTHGNCRQEITNTQKNNDAHEKEQKQNAQEQPKANPHEKAPQSKQKDTDAENQQNAKSKKKVCPFCALILSTRSALTRHVHLLHPDKDLRSTSAHPRNQYACIMCHTVTSDTLENLTLHYQIAHCQNVCIKEDNFPSMEHFQKWQARIEKSTLSKFSRKRGIKTTSTSKVHYFVCNRSGKVELKVPGERKRATKTQGSCKIDATCTAFMNAFCSLRDGSVHVVYCTDHIGHELELCHLRLSDDIKKLIAAKLKEGVSSHKILHDIREHSQIDRDTLLTNQDIDNIKQQYNISDIQKHDKNGLSTDLCIKQLQEDTESPIVYDKTQGHKTE